MPAKEKKPKEPKPPKQPSKGHQLIEAFLFSPPETRRDWGREMKLASKLLSENDFDFLIRQKGKQKMPSLAWFYTDNGKKFIKDIKSYESMNFSGESIILEEAPVAPTTNIERKPRSIKEFLNIF